MFNFAVKKGFFLYHKQSSWWEGLLLPGTHDLPMLHRVPHLCEMLGQLSTCLSPPWRSLTYWRREKSAMHNPVPEHHPGVLLHWHVAMHHPPRFNCIPFAMNIALHWFLKDQSKGNWWEYWCGNYTGQGLPKLIAPSTIIQDQAQTGPLWRVGQLYTWRMGRWTIIQYQDCRHVLAIRVIKCVKMIPVRNILRNPLNLERWQRQQRWQRERSTEHTWNCDWQATIGSWILCQDGVSPHFTTPTWWRTFPGDDIHLMITIIRDAFKNYLADVFRQGKGG